MAFCTNCGADAKDVNFCPKCGTQTNATGSAGPAVQTAQPAAAPRTVTVGQVKKCPSCGSPVESFQSRCGACGHDLGAAKVSEAIKEFSAEINVLDEKIANEKGQPVNPNTGKSTAGKSIASKSVTSSIKRGGAGAAGALLGSALTSSSRNVSSSNRSSTSSGSGTGKKVVGGLLIFGFLIGAIALIVKITKNFKAAIARPALSPSEKTKKSYIENFVVPNNREDMLEFVLLASSKAESVIDLGHGETMGELSSAHFWAKVWENKCKKVEDRALIALQGDSETIGHITKFHNRSKDVYKTITKAKKNGQVKSVIVFILMLIAIVVIASAVIFALLNFI